MRWRFGRWREEAIAPVVVAAVVVVGDGGGLGLSVVLQKIHQYYMTSSKQKATRNNNELNVIIWAD